EVCRPSGISTEVDMKTNQTKFDVRLADGTIVCLSQRAKVAKAKAEATGGTLYYEGTRKRPKWSLSALEQKKLEVATFKRRARKAQRNHSRASRRDRDGLGTSAQEA